MSPADLAASGIVAGDYVRLWSNAIFDAGRTNSKYGEIVRVLSVNAGTGALVFGYPDYGQPIAPQPIVFSYLVSDGAQIAKFLPVRDINLSGTCNIIGSGVSTARHIGIEMRSAINPYISQGWKGNNLGSRWLWLRSCLNVTLRLGMLRDSVADSTGYGVSISDASADVLVHGIQGNQIRHLITTNNSTTPIGIPIRVTVDGFYANNSSGAIGGSMGGGDAMDTHAAAAWVTFRNGVIFAPSGLAINMECAHPTIENVQVFGPVGGDQAIYCQNWSSLASIVTVKNIQYIGPAPVNGVVRIRNLGAGSIKHAVVDGVHCDSEVGRFVYVQNAVTAVVKNITGRGGNTASGAVLLTDCDTVKISSSLIEVMANAPSYRVDRAKKVFVSDLQAAVMPSSTLAMIYIDDDNTARLDTVLVNGCNGWPKSGTATPPLVRLVDVTGTPVTVVSADSNIPIGAGVLLA